MRKLSVFLMCLICSGLVWLDAAAQAPNAGIIYFKLRQFGIPFNKNQNSSNVAKVRLYVSTNEGQSWQHAGTVAPEVGRFPFTATQDGRYWFAVQTADAQGKLNPPDVTDLRPDLKVIIDTIPPAVLLQPLPPRNGEVGVSWTVRDDNYDPTLPDAVQLQYRLPGAANWTPLIIAPGSQQHYWNPRTSGAIEVRLLARDNANNIGEDKTTVSLGGVNSPNGAPPNADPFKAPSIQRKFVNNKRISLSYELSDVGRSGVSTVELWYTIYKAQRWTKLSDYKVDLKNGGEADQTKTLTFEVQTEGIYGITLVAKSGVGIGDQHPKTDDPPQFWIEVDLTRPVVEILNVNVGAGAEKGKLTVQWSAQDRNLGATPIRLSYAEQKDGPWTSISDKLPNSSRHVWNMANPDLLPYQFYLRVEAVDRAGNVGEAVTPEKVKVDLSIPKAKIKDIEPGGN